MERGYSKFLKVIHLAGDLTVLNVAFFMAGWFRFQGAYHLNSDFYLYLLIFLNLTWLLCSQFLDIYEYNRISRIERTMKNLLQILILQVLITSAFIVFLKGYYYSRLFLVVFFGLFALLQFTWRYSFLRFLKFYRARGYNYRRVVILGDNETGRAFKRHLAAHPEFGYKLLGFFDDNSHEATGKLTDVERFCREQHVDEIYCALKPEKNTSIEEHWQFAMKNMVRFRVLPDFGLQAQNMKLEFYSGIPVLISMKEPLEYLHNRFFKRLFDITFSFLVISLVLSWLIPLIAILIKLDSRGPVFFRQQRTGIKNEDFACLKFRTMRVNATSDNSQATRNDQRVTHIGGILRRTNLDELPQFFNVLLGQMSVVGPRPHMLMHTRQYSGSISNFMTRHLVKPGITGLAQISGYRGETRDPRLMKKRVELDVNYIENWSAWLDVKIIAQTIRLTIKGDPLAY